MARPFVKQDPTLPQGFSVTFRQRFWSKVDKNGPVPPHMPHLGNCWLWTGVPGSHGYGQLSPGSRGINQETSHRASWIIHYGIIPLDQCVLHKCDNRLCVRPDHLFLGTRIDNNRDALEKGRVPSGEQSVNHKLTSVQVQEIRSRYEPNVISESDLAKEYGVSQGVIHKILSGQGWRIQCTEDISAGARGIRPSLKGINNPLAKLNWKSVEFIRTRYISRHPKFSQLAMARRFRVTQSVIWAVLNNKTWNPEQQHQQR